jgi:hypothetical protein
MNDTTRRFLTGILERVDESRLVELRLFPALRQGGIESAVAVFAIEMPVPVVAATSAEVIEVEAPEHEEENFDSESRISNPESRETSPGSGDSSSDSRIPNPDSQIHDPESEDPAPDSRIPNPESRIHESGSSPNSESRIPNFDSQDPEAEVAERISERVAELRVTVEGGDEDATTEPLHEQLGDREVRAHTATPADLPTTEPDESIALNDILALPEPTRTTSPAERHGRLQIMSAWYRLVFKGPDRGNWTIEMVHEADAPLATLERVVSGVARRAGDTSEPELYSAQSLREALDQPAWV